MNVSWQIDDYFNHVITNCIMAFDQGEYDTAFSLKTHAIGLIRYARQNGILNQREWENINNILFYFPSETEWLPFHKLNIYVDKWWKNGGVGS